MMNDNIENAVNYLENNFKYGSITEVSYIERIANRFELDNDGCDQLLEDLESLTIKLVENRSQIKFLEHQIFDVLHAKSEVTEEELTQWFEKEKISLFTRRRINYIITESGYQITKTKPVIDFGFDDDVSHLDELLEDEEFKQEVERSTLVIDKQYNIDYLSTYQSPASSPEQKQKAIDALVNANQGLVRKIVRHYAHFSAPGFDEEDMTQAGNLGLLRAAQKFDATLENEFSTYAFFWIKQQIARGIDDHQSTIRMPVHMWEQIRKMTTIEQNWYREYCRNVTNEQLAECLSTTVEKIEKLKKYQNFSNLTSLDQPVSKEDGSTRLGELISDEQSVSTEKVILNDSLKVELREALNYRLTPREQEVLVLRFGLIDGEPETLEEIGAKFNVTRERIRQIETKSLRKLRASAKVSSKLKGYCDEY